MTGPAASYMVNGFDPNLIDSLDDSTREIVERRGRVLSPAYKLMYRSPINFVSASGVYMYDAEGRPYLDAYNNVACVGHCHPAVVAAITDQVGRLNTNTRYLDVPILDYTDRLLATHHSALSQAMYTCTGSEAVDLSLRVARFFTGGEGVIVTTNAYHGITAAAAECSPSLGPHVPVGRNIWTVAAPDLTLGDQQAGQKFAADVRAAFSDMRRHGVRPAALLVDTLFSTDGVLPATDGFLAAAVDVVRDEGVLFIADEVQPGFGRTGTNMWGYQNHEVLPDIAVMGKPMGNGMPIAGIAARAEVLAEFGSKTRFFNTFAANSVCIAAAAAVLDVIEREGLQSSADSVGQLLNRRIVELSEEFPQIGSVRGQGLYVGVDIVDPNTGQQDPAASLDIVNGLRDRRVLVSATGVNGQTLKIRPPLAFASEHAEHLARELGSVLAAQAN